MLPTTETLLNGLIAGDESRWARLYRDYAPWIENHLVRRLGLAHCDADDVIEETLAALVKIMPTYVYDKGNKGSFHSLLLKIASHKAIDLLRKRGRDDEKTERYLADSTNAPDSDWRRQCSRRRSPRIPPHAARHLRPRDASLPRNRRLRRSSRKRRETDHLASERQFRIGCARSDF